MKQLLAEDAHLRQRIRHGLENQQAHATSRTRHMVEDSFDPAQNAREIVDDLVLLCRRMDRVTADAELAELTSAQQARERIEEAVEALVAALGTVSGVVVPTAEEVRERALVAGPALWRAEKVLVLEFMRRERAITARTRPVVARVEELAEQLRAAAPITPEHPELPGWLVELDLLAMGLAQEIGLLDELIVELDDQDDLVGIEETVNARRCIVNMRESLANMVDTFPGIEFPHRWGPGPAG